MVRLAADAYGTVVASLVRLLQVHATEIDRLEEALSQGFAKHPDTELLRSLPGLGVVTGARALYHTRRAAGDTHSSALRAVANRLVGILHGCLRTHTTYNEHLAWGHRSSIAA